MSGSLVGLVIERSRAERSELWVLVVIAEMTRQKTSVCWPSVRTLARRCRLTDRAVQAAIGKLQALGELEVQRNAGHRGVNVYRVKLEALKQQKPPKRTSPPTPEVHFTPEEPEGCSPLHPTPEAGFTLPPKPTSPEPELNRKRTGKKESTRERVPAVVVEITVDQLVGEGVARDVAEEFLALRRRKRAPLTPLALKGIQTEAAKAGWSLDQALRKCVARGWQGFEAQWVTAARTRAEKAEEFAAQLVPLVARRTSHKAVAASSPTPFDFGLPMVERVDDE